MAWAWHLAVVPGTDPAGSAGRGSSRGSWGQGKGQLLAVGGGIQASGLGTRAASRSRGVGVHECRVLKDGSRMGAGAGALAARDVKGERGRAEPSGGNGGG